MEFNIKKSEDFKNTVVPEGEYQTVLVKIDSERIPAGEYGKRLAFDFEITSGEFKDLIVSSIVYDNFTERSRAGKLVMKMAGKDIIDEDFKVDAVDLLNKAYRVFIETIPAKGDRQAYSVIGKVLGRV